MEVLMCILKSFFLASHSGCLTEGLVKFHYSMHCIEHFHDQISSHLLELGWWLFLKQKSLVHPIQIACYLLQWLIIKKCSILGSELR